jgi:hypothetical protein
MITSKTKPSEYLKLLIQETELAQKEDEEALKLVFKQTIEIFNPLNLIKSTLSGVVSSSGAPLNLFSSLLSFSTGFIAKKMFTRNSGNFLVNLEGMIVQMMVSNKVANSSEELSSFIGDMVSKVKNWLNSPKTRKYY